MPFVKKITHLRTLFPKSKSGGKWWLARGRNVLMCKIVENCSKSERFNKIAKFVVFGGFDKILSCFLGNRAFEIAKVGKITPFLRKNDAKMLDLWKNSYFCVECKTLRKTDFSIIVIL